jgi:hypothetical protein
VDWVAGRACLLGAPPGAARAGAVTGATPAVRVCVRSNVQTTGNEEQEVKVQITHDIRGEHTRG